MFRLRNVVLACPTTIKNMFFYFILTDILIELNGIAFHFYTAHFLYCKSGAAPFFRTAQTIGVVFQCHVATPLSYLTRRHHVIRTSLTSIFFARIDKLTLLTQFFGYKGAFGNNR